MSIKESALSVISSIAQSDFVRAVTSDGNSRRVTVANLAKAIVESYTGSSLGGSQRSVKAAIDSLNSKTTGTITKDSSISDGTLDSTSLVKVGNTVFASARLYGISAVANGNFFSVPANFRPQYNARVYGYMIIDGTVIPAAPFVRPDGTVNFAYSSSRTTTQVYFAGSWSVL